MNNGPDDKHDFDARCALRHDVLPDDPSGEQAEKGCTADAGQLKKGDIITTIGGIVAKIVSVQQDTIIVETSEDRVRMEFTKWAVSTVGVQTGEQPEAKKKEKQPEEIPAEVPEEPAEAPAEDTKE